MLSWVLSALFVSLVCAGDLPANQPPRTASDRTILLVDDGDVLYRSGTQRILTPLTRHPANPLISPNRPWEVAIAWASVYREPDTGHYQLWYQGYAGNVARERTHQCVVCYAESDDGIHFTKPSLGLFAFNGIKETNIVLLANGGTSDRYGNSVIVEPRELNPARRYKMVYFDFAKEGGDEYPGLCVAFSPDGIHWTKHPDAPLLRASYGNHGEPVPFSNQTDRRWALPLAVADALDVFYDPRLGVYACYGKMWIDAPDGGMYWKHAMCRTQSKDFIHWSRPKLVLTPDDLDPPQVEFHTSPVFFYNDRYFCLNQILDRATGGGVIDIELMVSPNGMDWQRPFRKQFVLARSPGQQFDSGSIFTSSTPVILKNEIRFYYGGYSQGATGADDYKQLSGIGLATLPLDRFAGIRPTAISSQPTLKQPLRNVGQVTLKPVELCQYAGLTLNADATSGTIRVELLDMEGRRVPGFSAEDCLPITGDSLRHAVAWKNRGLPDLPNGEYMPRLHLHDATVYAMTLLARTK